MTVQVVRVCRLVRCDWKEGGKHGGSFVLQLEWTTTDGRSAPAGAAHALPRTGDAGYLAACRAKVA